MPDEEGFKLAAAYVEVHPDLSGFEDEAKAKIDAATQNLGATAKLTADDSDLTAKTADATAKVDEFGGKTGTARLGVDAASVDEGVASADAKVDEFGGKTATARAKLDSAGLDAEVAKDDAELDHIDGRTVTAHAKLDSSGFSLGGLFSGGLTSPGSIAGITLGSGALLPALPGAFAGAGAAAGTLGLAIAGVSKALSDYSAKQQGAASATGQSASSQVSAAHTIASAQQALAQAQTQAAHDQITSAEAVKAAQQSLQQAETQQAHDAITSAEQIKAAQQGVASAVQQAAQSEISAEEQLANAQYSEQQAQESLTQARQQAILTLQQLENASADAALNVQQDQLNLQQAEQNQAAVDANSKSTALQRAQAALAVKEAEQQLKEAIEARTNSSKAAQTAEKQGVSGNPQVLAAEHALQQAKQAVADAQRNLANVERQGAQSIANAERSLADAIRSASWQRVADAQNVSKAQQGVADASRNARWSQQADAAAVKNAQDNLAYAYASAGAAAGKASSASKTYARDLAALTPAGRQFVQAITGMMGALHSLEGVSEKALLPGLTALMKGLKSIGPEISREVGQMGGLLSRGFSTIGKELASSGFQKELRALFTEGNRFIAILGPAVNKLVLAFMKMGTEGGPALTGLAKGLSAILGGVGKLFTTLGKFSKAGGSILETLGKAVGALGGPLGTVIGTLLKAFAPLLSGALPLFTSLLDQIARVVKSAGPGLLALGQTLGQMLTAITPLAPVLGSIVVDLVRLAEAAILPLLPVLPTLVKLLVSLVEIALLPLQPVLVAITPIVKILAEAISLLLLPLTPLTNAFGEIDSALQGVNGSFGSVSQSAQNLKDVWNDIASFTTKIWNDISSFFSNWWGSIEAAWKQDLGFVTSLLSGTWHGITGTVKDDWDAISSFFSGWWDDIKSAWKTDVNAVTGVLSGAWGGIESTVRTVWGRISSFFTGFWHDLRQGASAAVSALGTAWGHIENVFKTPVNFLISKVYMDGIRRLWDDVVNAIGLSKLDLPAVSSLAQGGKVTQGTTSTADDVLIRASKGETMVSAAHSKMLAPAFAAVGVPGYAAGGIPNPITGIKHLISGAIDVGKIVAALATGNTTAFANALSGLVKTNASGQYATLMTKAPEKLISDIVGGAAKSLTGSAASSGAGGSIGPYGKGVAQWRPDVLKVLAMLNQPASDVGVVLSQMNTESTGNPLAVNKWDCLTIDAMILTRRGWLKHDEVQVGDETIGYNAETGRSEWTRVTRVVHFEDAPLVRMGNSRWHATTTPNHRWLNMPHVAVPQVAVPDSCPHCEWPHIPGLRRRGKSSRGGVQIHLARAHGIKGAGSVTAYASKPSWITTEKVSGAARLMLAAPAETESSLDITTEEAAILGWIAGDGHVEPSCPTPAECAARGYTPTGVCREHGSRQNPSMSISQSKPAMVTKLRALLAGVPHAVYVDDRPTRTGKPSCGPRHVFRLDYRWVADLRRRAGHPKSDALRQVLAMSTEQRTAWLEAMIDAEGHRAQGQTEATKERVLIAQTFGPVLDAITVAVYLAGYRPRVRDTKVDNVRWAPSATVAMNIPFVTASYLHKEDAGRGTVWCVTTELGSWTAEDDGHVFLTGNSNWAAGHPSTGLMQVIAGTFDEYAGRYRNTGPFEYGVSVNPMANIYAGLNYAIHRYGANWTSVLGHGHGYDSGGWLQPGGIPVNGLRKPEAVLTPDESAAFIALVKGLVAGGTGRQGTTGMRPGGGAPVSVNYFGTQWPTPEQEQAMLLKLASAIGTA